ALVADGVREVTFLGQNVNAYGRDLRGSQKSDTTRTFAGLLRMADAVGGLDRIRFLTSHPKDLGDEMIAAMAQAPAVCEHLHLPVQSGSNAVLERMRRGYSAQMYLRLLDKVRAALPDVAITTDLIVGFPGETEADFVATLELVERARFDAAFTFVYSPRHGTDAATMPDQISEDIKHERVRRLIARTQAIGRERRGRFVGRRLEVLVEGASRDGDGLRGRTRHNVTVNFGGRAAPGQLVEVAITAATSTTLRGTV
ncbi:MAG: MiaB/RimO family radical SAM methylthiotransferase, partial [Actinobacteria bacterium]|nr:MiaB/RimO family radical SAM methylthiotransferase [Actinomycetota bacterium]